MEQGIPNVTENLDLGPSQSPGIGRSNLAPISNRDNVKKQSWWQLLSIQVGGTLCFPIILVGALLCQHYGWLAALCAVVCGNIFLLIGGYFLASLSTFRPQTTVE